MNKKLVMALAMALGVSGTALAANPFSDLPAGHWAYGAVAKLAAAGVVDGYPDGTFKGDKTMTRYEMAQIVAKALAKGAIGADDKLVSEFADELDNLGVRVAKLEKNADNVQITGEVQMSYRNDSGSATGKDKAEVAAKMAISSPLLETSIDGAKGVIINITGSVDMSLEEVDLASQIVHDAAHPDANIIWGVSCDENLEDEIHITVIATGFEKDPEDFEIPNYKFKSEPSQKVTGAAAENNASAENAGTASAEGTAAGEDDRRLYQCRVSPDGAGHRSNRCNREGRTLYPAACRYRCPSSPGRK